MGTAKIGEERRKRGHPSNKDKKNKKKRITRLDGMCSAGNKLRQVVLRVYSVTYLPFTFPSEEIIWGCQLVGEESGTMRGGDGSDMGWTLEDRA